MSESGLEGVLNPCEMFLTDQHSDSDFLAGLAVAVIMDGSRAFLIEVQAMFIFSLICASVSLGSQDKLKFIMTDWSGIVKINMDEYSDHFQEQQAITLHSWKFTILQVDTIYLAPFC